MQFLSMREFSKTPGVALSRLALDGKAVLTNHGKPAALMINVDTENFEMVFDLVQEVERQISMVSVYSPTASSRERMEAYNRLMNFPRAKLPPDFDWKKERAEAIDERFNRID